jgi:hypothetical protein
MPDERRPSPPSRRAFLRALAAVPAVAAGCATSRAEAPGAAAAAPAPKAPPAAAAPPDEGLAAVRSFPLAMDDEPAFVFRAAIPRQQE